MGPAPMIRMVEMSVRLGIKSHGMELGTKKGRAGRASPLPQREGTPRARLVFRPVSTPAKPPKTGHQRGNSGKSERLAEARLRPSGYAAAAFATEGLPSRSCGAAKAGGP